MMHIPSVSWSSEVLRLKAEVLARAMEKDPRVADLAPVIRGAADRLAAAAETAHATRLEERACRATFDQCEEAAVKGCEFVAHGFPAEVTFFGQIVELLRWSGHAKERVPCSPSGLTDRLAFRRGPQGQPGFWSGSQFRARR